MSPYDVASNVSQALVLGLADGQARHSADEFYAGSWWKVSVQAFSDEDPKGRRTLGRAARYCAPRHRHVIAALSLCHRHVMAAS